MNSLLLAILLGFVQGFGEFLPISSSAHLILMPWFFNTPDPGLAFDVMLHMGTLVALVLVFWKDFWKLLLAFFKTFTRERNWKDLDQRLSWFLLLATIPGAIFGYLLEDYAETTLRNPLLIAGTLTILGLILFLVDRASTKRNNIEHMMWWDSLLIGIAQAIAVIPGVSRSGATITMGLLRNLDRESAAKFSFLLSAPIIFGAGLVKVPHLLGQGVTLEIVAGFLAALISGYIAITFLLKFIKKYTYAAFFYYRLALAALILVMWSLR